MKRVTSFLLAIVLLAGFVLTAAPEAKAASAMTASDSMIAVLKQEEGFSKTPYWDYAQYTVGYGTACPADMVDYYMQNGITEEAAEVLLRNYLANTENTINKKFIDKYGLTLTQGQFDALVSFTYNCGSGWISETNGTFHNAVKNGASGSELIRAFSLWCSAGGKILPGLVRRRLSEANMFLNSQYSRTAPANYCYVYYNPNGGSVSYKIQGYDSNLGTAPAYTASKSGSTFQGWYTAQVGGTKVTTLTQALSGTTLYARWDTPQEDTPAATPDQSVLVTVTGTGVNLRKGPGTNYGIVGRVTVGDQMLITETAHCSTYHWGNAGGKWVALKYTNYDAVVAEMQKATETTEPETTAPEETTTETVAPETTVPEETTAPETTAPETTDPEETTAPETTVPEETTAPETTVPEETTAPETTVPEETTAPETTVPEETTAPETTVPEETTAPEETTVPETTAPEETVPETTVPAETEPAPTEPPKPAPVSGTVRANGGLALRKGPGTGYGRIRYLRNGSRVTVYEQTVAGNMTWGNVGEGWVSMSYVALDSAAPAPAPEATTPPASSGSSSVGGTVRASGGLAVRNGPATSYSLRRYLRNGSRITVYEQQTVNGMPWGKIDDGWVCLNYVNLDGGSSGSSAVTKKVVADCLRIRSGAGTGNSVVGYAYYGSSMTIYETTSAGGTTWGRCSKGWVSMDYLR